jgi:hypothetical protein
MWKNACVFGGARSGKSAFAENLIITTGRRRIYIATAEAWDDEMRDRIAAHRLDRGGLNRPWTLAMGAATMEATQVRRVRPPADTGGGGSRPSDTRSDASIRASKQSRAAASSPPAWDSRVCCVERTRAR